MTQELIIFLYAIGLLFFVFGIEETKMPNNFIYLIISFMVNLMGYMSSYTHADFLSYAYLPLSLLALTTIILLYSGFGVLKNMFSDDYKEENDND